MNSNLRLLILFCIYGALNFSFQPQQSSLGAQPCSLCGTTASEWIAGIVIDGGSGLNAPGGSIGGCYDQFLIDGYFIILKKGVSHTFSLTPGFSGATQSEYWKIWIDLNHDGDFNDPDDLVFASGSGSTTTISGSFFIPLSTTTGPAAIRVAMHRGSLPPDCGNYSKGQELTYSSAYIDECNISFYDACSREYIKQVNLQTINNTSGCSTSGYQDFTNTSTTLNVGNSYPVQLTPGFFGAQYPERWLIWIDFNNDYDFDDPGEKVFDSGAIGNANATNGTINIPSNAPNVTTRMRIKMIPTDVNTVTLDPCDPVPGGFLGPDQYGEAEDYTVTITNAPPNPTFLLTTSVNSLHVCAGTNATFVANLTSIQGFNSPVSLGVTGGPSGASLNISPNPVVPTGGATITLSGITAGMVGSYFLTVKGEGGNISQITTVALTITASYLGVPSAVSPSDGSTGVGTTVLLSWTGVPNASTYMVEVATNPSFSAGSIVWSQTVSIPNTTANGLLSETAYYWRIRAINDCGISNFSTTYAFQTQRNLCLYIDLLTLAEINPNTINTATVTFDVSEDKIISDVNVGFFVDHTFVGDLSASLVSPSNQTVLLFDRPGVPATTYGCSGADASLEFDSQAANNAALLENQCNNFSPALSGTFQPIQSLDILNGGNMKGNWKLMVTDNYPQDGGYINHVDFHICYSESIPAGNILANSPLNINTGQSKFIPQSLLKMGITGSSVQGLFTLLSVPQHGILTLNGASLLLGGTFTQEDINNNKLVYTNNGDGALADDFRFDALDLNNNFWVHNTDFNINITGVPIIVTAAITAGIPCHNGTTGAITVTAIPLNNNYTYSINGGPSQSNNIFGGLTAGTYTVVVTGQFGITATTTVTLINPPAITVTASVASDDLTVNATGGTGGLTYSINGVDFQSSNLFQNLANGNYSITVHDVNGCSATTQATISVNNLQVNVNIQSQISCSGANNGAIIVMASGGLLPYTYSLNGSSPQSANVFVNLSPGNYTVLVTDNQGFGAVSTPIIITNPNPISAAVNVVSDKIIVTASGGTGTLTYSINGTSFQMSNVFLNLCNGTYTVTVRDANGCTTIAQAVVTANPLLVNLNVTHTINCAGGSDGSLNAVVTGGQSPFSYHLNGGPPQSSNVFNNLSAGSYSVVLIDNVGCIASSTSTVLNNPPALQIATSVNSNVITVQASGGTGFLQYSIDGINFQTGNQFSNLSCGTYIVTVRDANGCTATKQVDVSVLSGSFQTSTISCFGGSANIIINASCGVPQYQYKLGNGQFQSSNIFSGVNAGTYLVTIKDGIGTTLILGPIVINQPLQFHAATTVICNDATLTFTGGTPPYSFTSNPPDPDLQNLTNGMYHVTATDGNGCTTTATFTVNVLPLGVSLITDSVLCFGGNSGSITANGFGGCSPYTYSLIGSPFLPINSFSNLAAGTYSLAVKDAKGNLNSTFVTIFQPSLLTITATLNGNTITANSSGGTPPYTYSLNGSMPHSSNTFSNLAPGNYTIITSDVNGCTASNLLVVTGTVEPSVAWGLSVSPNPSSGLFDLMLQNAPDELNAELFDVTGHLLQSLNLHPVGGQLRTFFDLQDLPQGIYLLRLSDGKNWGGVRLVKVD